MLYRANVLEESGDYQAVLDHLLKFQQQICDKVSWNEKHGKYFDSNSITFKWFHVGSRNVVECGKFGGSPESIRRFD
jgi:hypothetical protein